MSKVKIRCTRCSKSFNENHTKVRSGMTVTCPLCSAALFLDSSSDDLNVRRALSAARQLRLTLKT